MWGRWCCGWTEGRKEGRKEGRDGEERSELERRDKMREGGLSREWEELSCIRVCDVSGL